MKLYARTPAGTGLGLDVLLTGQLNESDGKIRSIEVSLPNGCVQVVGCRIKTMPKMPRGRQLLWTDPADIYADDGDSLSPEELRNEAARVREKRRAEMLHGPLGENWP